MFLQAQSKLLQNEKKVMAGTSLSVRNSVQHLLLINPLESFSLCCSSFFYPSLSLSDFLLRTCYLHRHRAIFIHRYVLWSMMEHPSTTNCCRTQEYHCTVCINSALNGSGGEEEVSVLDRKSIESREIGDCVGCQIDLENSQNWMEFTAFTLYFLSGKPQSFDIVPL